MLATEVIKSGFNLIQHPAVDTHEDIKRICKPLLDLFNINFFRYLRVYPDKTRIHLCTNPHWTELFYAKGLYNVAWFDSNKIGKPKSVEILWDVKANTDDNIVGIEARNHFNIHHGMSIIRAQKSYYEVYDLATCKNNTKINNVYLSNLDLFERFFFYFKDQSKNLILSYDKKRIKIPDLLGYQEIEKEKNIFSKNKLINKFIHSTKTKKFYINTIGGDIYLTEKEVECMYWTIIGKSAEEISFILKCSRRTVENHLNNSKQKIGVEKITQAAKIVIDSGVMEALKFDLEKPCDI